MQFVNILGRQKNVQKIPLTFDMHYQYLMYITSLLFTSI